MIGSRRLPAHRCVLVVVAALAVGGCTSSTPVAPTTTSAPAPSHPSAAAQAAALSATEAYRADMTRAGERLASALSASPPDLPTARLALDEVRAQDTADATVLETGTSAGAAPAALADAVSSAARVELLLTRAILPASGIARAAQRQASWLSASATDALLTPSADLSSADLSATAASLGRSFSALVPLGELVAPRQTAATQRVVAALLASLGGQATPRLVVSASDATVRALGQLAVDLEGLGQSSLYQ